MQWRDISTKPKTETKPFMVLRFDEDGRALMVQVTIFEGRMYPDQLGAAIDYEDAITDATHWADRGAIPNLMTIEHEI